MSGEVKNNEVMFKRRIKNDQAGAILWADALGETCDKCRFALIERSENEQALPGEQYYKRGANDLIAFYQPDFQS